MSDPPVVRRLADLDKRAIAPGDTVRLVPLAGPAQGSPASVFFEIWEPGGAQPVNSHPASTEVFVVLAGEGRAHSDEHVVELVAGDVLVLPAGSAHRIENSSATARLYAVTVMAEDLGAMPGGFAALVAAGTPIPLDDTDVTTLFHPTREQDR